MDGDHIHADQLLGAADPLGHDLAEMRHELDVELPDLAAGVADTEVVGDHPLLLRVKRPVHRERGRQPVARAGLSARLVRSREEESVTLDLHESQGRDGVEHRFEQPLRDLLRVSEVQPVRPHELRVAGDVREEKQRSIRHPSCRV
jgi:hypothetical protein